MKNYDAIMQSMTPERMAETNVKLVTVNNTNLFYMTSTGQLFNTNQLEDAIRYEYNWLMNDPNPEQAAESSDVRPDCCDTESCKCESCDCEQAN